VLAAAADDPEDYALLVTALDTLQRLTSVASLQWTHDKGESLVFLNAKVSSKTKRGNWINVSSRLRAALDALPRRGPFVFQKFQRRTRPSQADVARESVSSRRQAVQELFLRRCRQAGILTGRADGGVTFHCLRHTGATAMLQGGADIRTVMEIGGWRRLEQMTRYLHADRASKQRAVEMVGARGIARTA
jgi:integrase